MPQAAIPSHIAIRAALTDLIGEAADLAGRLEEFITVKSRQPGAFHGKVDHSQPPWCAPVAYAITDLHALSRMLEKDIRRKLGLPFRDRGSSDDNTRRALETIARLTEGADDQLVREYLHEISRWLRTAKMAALAAGDNSPGLDEVEMPKRLPRAPGKPEACCPYCENHTLRVKVAGNEIFCLNPRCRDADGNKPKASMDYSKIVGDWIFRWQDGVIMGVA